MLQIKICTQLYRSEMKQNKWIKEIPLGVDKRILITTFTMWEQWHL